MTTHRTTGDALRGRQIVVLVERIRVDSQRVKLTSDHTGQKAKARGEAYAYIDIPFQSVPRSVRPT